MLGQGKYRDFFSDLSHLRKYWERRKQTTSIRSRLWEIIAFFRDIVELTLLIFGPQNQDMRLFAKIL